MDSTAKNVQETQFSEKEYQNSYPDRIFRIRPSLRRSYLPLSVGLLIGHQLERGPF